MEERLNETEKSAENEIITPAKAKWPVQAKILIACLLLLLLVGLIIIIIIYVISKSNKEDDKN